jgi:YD repeat-containing protein
MEMEKTKNWLIIFEIAILFIMGATTHGYSCSLEQDTDCAFDRPPEYGPSVSLDWGESGPNIVIERDGCNGYRVTPAILYFDVSGKMYEAEYWDCGYNCSKSSYWRVGYRLTAEDENEFIQADFQSYGQDCISTYFPIESPGLYQITTISLSIPEEGIDCEFLKNLKDIKLKMKIERSTRASAVYRIIGAVCCDPDYDLRCWSDDDYDEGDVISSIDWAIYNRDFGTVEVGVIVVDNGESPCENPGNPGNSPGNNPGSCTSCNSGKDGSQITIGNATAKIRQSQSDTMTFYASVIGGSVEANMNGGWVKYKNGSTTVKDYTVVYDYEQEGDNYTRVVIDITNPEGEIYHYVSDSGSWPSTYELQNGIKGRIPLREVLDKNHHTKLLYDYDYTSNRVTVTSKTYPETTPSYMIYQGGIDTSRPEETLSRIWAGNNLSEYSASGEPTGGRWLDLETQIQPNSDMAYITQVSACGSCNGATKNVAYMESRVNRDFTNAGQIVVDKPSSFKVYEVKDAQSNVLARYTYDNKDRYKEYYLGDREKLVTRWKHTDRDFKWDDDQYVMEGDNSLLRKDYVDETHYRANLYLYDQSGKMTEERAYCDLQTTEVPTGLYAATNYTYHKDSNGNITKEITRYPKGNTLKKEYENIDYDGVWKVTKRTYNDSLVEAQYDYRYVAGDYKVSQEINANGGVTDYAYDSNGDVTRQISPAPGVFGLTGRLTTHYEYDDDRRLTKEWTESTSQATTFYFYDEFDNLTKQARGNLESRYEYNEYNEQTLSYDYDTVNDETRNIQRTFYSNAGAVIAKANYTDETTNAAVSAVIYEYDSNGRMITQRTAKEDTTFTFGGSAGSINWVDEVYQYDAYGRKTAVIADAGGENLTTQYEYNNQSEVVRIIQPDNHYTETVRDGRGLVSQTITGVYNSGNYIPKATTSYYYDLNGNLKKKVDPEGVTEIYKYDAMDRMIRSQRVKPSN